MSEVIRMYIGGFIALIAAFIVAGADTSIWVSGAAIALFAAGLIVPS